MNQILVILFVLALLAGFGEATICRNASLHQKCIGISETLCFAQDVAIINSDTAQVDLKIVMDNNATIVTLTQGGLYVLKQFTNLTLASSDLATDSNAVCLDIKPLDLYSKISVFKTIRHNITGGDWNSIWRLRISKLDKEEKYTLKIQTDAQILSEINIFGSSRLERHKFMSSTIFPLGGIGDEVLIEVDNIMDQTQLMKNRDLTKSYNLTAISERAPKPNARIQFQSIGSILILIVPSFLPFICVSILCPFPCCEKMKTNWLPLAVFGTTFLAVLAKTALIVHNVENGFEIEECRQNFRCFDETVYIFRGMPLPANKIWSSSYFISLGFGIILAANFRISLRFRNLLGLPIVIGWNCYFSAFGGIMILQGIGSIIYHQCPNNITKGIDVIPMQATALLATQYILVKILLQEMGRLDQVRSGPGQLSPDETGSSPTLSDYCIINCQNKNIEQIISVLTILIQWIMIGLTICQQIFTSNQDVKIPVVFMFILYLGSVIVTSVFVCRKRRMKEEKLFQSKIGIPLMVVAISTFIGACYCFHVGSTTTSGDPWESREKNLDCWIGMFDQHDLWHFLIATSLACQIYRIWSCCDQQNNNVNYEPNQNVNSQPDNGVNGLQLPLLQLTAAPVGISIEGFQY